jgi:hypothetical protein
MKLCKYIIQILQSSGSGDHFKTENGDFRITCKLWEWANRVKFHQVDSPNSVGPLLFPIGPPYLHRGRCIALSDFIFAICMVNQQFYI